MSILILFIHVYMYIYYSFFKVFIDERILKLECLVKTCTGVVSIFGDVGKEYSNYFCHYTEDLQKMSVSEIFWHT